MRAWCALDARGTPGDYRIAGEDVGALLALLRDVATGHLADADRAAADYLGVVPDQAAQPVQREELLERVRIGDVVVLDVRPSVDIPLPRPGGGVRGIDGLEELRRSTACRC